MMIADLVRALIDAARKAGAEAAGVLAIDGTALSIDGCERRLQHVERAAPIAR